jgi:hypothetical protein
MSQVNETPVGGKTIFIIILLTVFFTAISFYHGYNEGQLAEQLDCKEKVKAYGTLDSCNCLTMKQREQLMNRGGVYSRLGVFGN